jgi:hypothetical protein
MTLLLPFLYATSRYLTTWSVAVVALHAYTHPHVHLLALTAFVCLAGTWLTHVHPRKYVISVAGRDRTFDGPAAAALNVAFHVLPFAFVALTYGSYYTNCRGWFPGTLALFLAYLAYVRGDLSSVYRTTVHPWALTAAFTAFALAFAIIPCLTTEA